jgi:uncharacterized protein YdaU (DUF1376 family)
MTDTTLSAAVPDEKVDAWMPLWIGAYLADTMRLTTKQHGAYLLLLFAYWRNRGPLEDDDEDLASTVKATLKEWRTELRPKLERFFDVDGGLWSHGRADKELAKAGQHKQAKAGRAAAGGKARWESADAQERGRHLRSQRIAAAREKGTHTAAEWEAMKTYHGFSCCRCKAAGVELVKDHIQPIYQGGDDSIANIQPLCRRCNASKGPEAIDHRLAFWEKAIDASEAGIQEGIGGLLNACPTPSPSSIPSVQKKKSARTHAPPPPPAVEPSALVEVGFTPELAAEFIAHKARLKAPLTPLAWADHQREAAKARWSPLQAAEKVMAKGWKGFEAKYVADERPDRPAESFAQRAARERVEAIAPGVARKAPTTTKPLMEVFDVSARRLD